MPMPGVYNPLATFTDPNNGGFVLNAGAIKASRKGGITSSTSLVDNCNVDRQQHVRPKLPRGITGSSGNLGTWQGNTGARFNVELNNRQSLIIKSLTGLTIAGNSGINLFAGAETSFRQTNGLAGYFYNQTRQNITDWSYKTGAATYGSQRGVSVLASGFSGQTGKLADRLIPTTAVAHRFTYMIGAINPSTSTKGRTG